MKKIDPQKELDKINDQLHDHCEEAKPEFRNELWKEKYKHLCRLQKLYRAVLEKQKIK